MASKCVVDTAMSKKGLFVLAGAAAGAFLLPQNAPIGAIAGGFVIMMLAGSL